MTKFVPKTLALGVRELVHGVSVSEEAKQMTAEARFGDLEFALNMLRVLMQTGYQSVDKKVNNLDFHSIREPVQIGYQ